MTEKQKYWFPSGVYTLLQNVVLFISGFTSFVLLVRFYDKSEFGTWALYLAFSSFIDVAQAGFVTNGLIKFASLQNKKSEYSNVLTASLVLQILFTVMIIILILIFAPILGNAWRNINLQKLLMNYPIYAISQIPFQFLIAVEQANFSFKNQFYGNLIRNVIFLTLISVIVFSHSNFPVYALPLIQAIAVLSGAFVLYYSLRKELHLSFGIDFNWIKQLINFGKYVFGSNVVSILFTNIDQILLGYYFDTKAVATYNTAMRVGNFSDIPLNSVATIVYPKTNQRLQSLGEKSLRHLYEKSVALILAFVIPSSIILILLTEPIIKLIATEQYLDVIPVIYIIICFSYFKPFIRYSGLIFQALNKSEIQFRLLIFLLFINFVLDILLIPKYNLIGAGVGSIISLFIGIFIALNLLKKMLDVQIRRIFRYTFEYYFDLIEFAIFFEEYKEYFEEKKSEKGNELFKEK